LVLVWIGIAVGVLIVAILIVKIIKTPFHETVSLSVNCKKCGYKTNGLKCPKCDKNSFYSDKYK
jgi:C4-type Zn-finger protein